MVDSVARKQCCPKLPLTVRTGACFGNERIQRLPSVQSPSTEPADPRTWLGHATDRRSLPSVASHAMR
jgi:hypothetical protein